MTRAKQRKKQTSETSDTTWRHSHPTIILFFLVGRQTSYKSQCEICGFVFKPTVHWPGAPCTLRKDLSAKDKNLAVRSLTWVFTKELWPKLGHLQSLIFWPFFNLFFYLEANNGNPRNIWEWDASGSGLPVREKRWCFDGHCSGIPGALQHLQENSPVAPGCGVRCLHAGKSCHVQARGAARNPEKINNVFQNLSIKRSKGAYIFRIPVVPLLLLNRLSCRCWSKERPTCPIWGAPWPTCKSSSRQLAYLFQYGSLIPRRQSPISLRSIACLEIKFTSFNIRQDSRIDVSMLFWGWRFLRLQEEHHSFGKPWPLASLQPWPRRWWLIFTATMVGRAWPSWRSTAGV